MNERDKELANVIYGSQWTTQDLHFADLIRSDEREACALMADDAMFVELADKIRARGNT